MNDFFFLNNLIQYTKFVYKNISNIKFEKINHTNSTHDISQKKRDKIK